MVLKICILEADTIQSELIPSFHGYGRMFNALFTNRSVDVMTKVYNVVAGHYPADEEHWDAYLVTGSKADSFGEIAWVLKLKNYLQKQFTKGKILIGICFGHQLLALSLGGMVARSKQGWGVGVHTYKVIQQYEWMLPQLDVLNLLVSHQDQVIQLPDNAICFALNDFCQNAGFVIENQVLCFQAHPEFISSYAKALLDVRRQVLGDLLYSNAMDSLDCEQNGSIVAEWIINFIKKAEDKKASF